MARAAGVEQQLLRLARFSREAVRASDETGIFWLAVAAALEVVPARHGCVLAYDASRSELKVAAASGLEPETVERFRLPADQGLAGAALKTRALVSARVGRDPRFVRFAWQKDRFDSLLCVPLFSLQGEPLGVLCLGGGRRGFSARHGQLMTVLASLTVAAVEHHRLLRQASRRLQEVSTLLETSRSIQSVVDMGETLDLIAREAVKVASDAQLGAVFLVSEGGQLEAHALVGYHEMGLAGPDVELRRCAQEALRQRRGLIFQDLATSPAGPAPQGPGREQEQQPGGQQETGPAAACRSVVAVPILLGGRVAGVLAVANLRESRAFDEDDLQVLDALASHAAIAIERNRLNEQRRNLYLSGVRTLVAAIDARDPSARGHSDRVAFYSRRIAQVLGMSPEWTERVELAALLHDVGKIGIADSVLRKPGPLGPAERAVMMSHVELGARILMANQALADLVPLVRHHHEWHSGGGYPDGLAGDAIPLGAAIISVADAFDTMVTGRPYRPALPLEEAVAELRRCAGTQFRPDVVEAMVRALEEDERAGEPYIYQLRQQAALLATGGMRSPQPASPSGAQPGLAAGAAAAPLAAAPSGAGAAGETAGLPGGQAGSEEQAAGAASAQAARLEVADGGIVPVSMGPVAGRITPVQTRELAAMYRMAQLVRDIVDLPTLLRHIVRIVEQELQMNDCALFLVDDETGDLVLSAATGSFVGFEGLRLRPNQGINGWVARHGVAALVPDVSREPRYYPGPPTTRSELVVPLVASGKVLGTLTVDSPSLNAFSVEEAQALQHMAQQAAMAIEVAKLHEQAHRAALRDGLTDLFNHRYFYERLEEEIERAGRYGYGLQVGIGDVDGLKDVNDNLGHLAGDAVLVQLAKLLRQHSRRYDIVARYGGDEFGIIMPQTDRPGAIQALHRLDRAVAQATFTWYGLELQLPAISWGLASFPEDGRRSSELVAAADARMYMAKRERQVRVTAREVRPPPLEFLHGLAAEEEHGPDGRPHEPLPPQEAAGGETPPQA
ncbi:MAG TPA: GAF domain-containing protein [Limnochordales bacterium]